MSDIKISEERFLELIHLSNKYNELKDKLGDAIINESTIRGWDGKTDTLPSISEKIVKDWGLTGFDFFK